jgi:hypothetical protein
VATGRVEEEEDERSKFVHRTRWREGDEEEEEDQEDEGDEGEEACRVLMRRAARIS